MGQRYTELDAMKMIIEDRPSFVEEIEDNGVHGYSDDVKVLRVLAVNHFEQQMHVDLVFTRNGYFQGFTFPITVLNTEFLKPSESAAFKNN